MRKRTARTDIQCWKVLDLGVNESLRDYLETKGSVRDRPIKSLISSWHTWNLKRSRVFTAKGPHEKEIEKLTVDFRGHGRCSMHTARGISRVINVGLHSFATLRRAENHIGIFTLNSSMISAANRNKSIIIEFYIPKGTEYYFNARDGEYVSVKLGYKKPTY